MNDNTGAGWIADYYYHAVFDNWEAAKEAQEKALLKVLALGDGIRAASIDCEEDFDSKKPRFSVFVRGFVMNKEYNNDDIE